MGRCDAAPIKLCRQRIHLDHSLVDGYSIERTPVVRQFWFEHFRELRFCGASDLTIWELIGSINTSAFRYLSGETSHKRDSTCRGIAAVRNI
jgi:hypothetical protein